MGIHSADLKRQAGKIAQEGTDLATDLVGLVRALEGVGNFWGDDEAGQTFYEGADGKPGYRVRHDGGLTDALAIVAGYEKIAMRLQQMGDNVDVANWNVIVSLPKVPE
ncbi:hypothetical protein NE236_31035 [Actinoallomurus purpureus]|uniref:hypothetical protein n=1 Tax=Actinoallomurus purpureus TaxID=478114 RepID=UPI0020936451|nr:hypothetical protein [Actinoallomurus purpureus]MCO6009415.1 hypothetical protein [Actinoallomurus purpureus]